MATIVRVNTGAAPPFGTVGADIAEIGGVEEEYIFEGTATQYRLAGGATEYDPDGRWAIEPQSTAPFRTRMVVLRPGNPAEFTGTVVVSWNNVSIGADHWMTGRSARQLLGDGFALVGVSAQKVGIDGMPKVTLRGDPGLPAFERPAPLRKHDPERYGDLDHPGDGYSFDIFTQASELLRQRSGRILPLGDLEVRNLVATGGSQSACRLATYVNAFEPLTKAYDGFLLSVYAGVGCFVNPDSVVEWENMPTNYVQLLAWRTHKLRTDLGVPIILLNSETEADQCHPNGQSDTEMVRWWEFAGTAHISLGRPEDPLAIQGGQNTVSFAYASRAALHAIRSWLGGGDPPPHQPRMRHQGSPPAFARDEHGNALGGIRLPDLEAPLGTHVGATPPGEMLRMMGSSAPFPPEKIKALYGNRDNWFAKYKAAVDHLVATKVVLPDDAAQIVADAATMQVGL
jgi:hypothetical protein